MLPFFSFSNKILKVNQIIVLNLRTLYTGSSLQLLNFSFNWYFMEVKFSIQKFNKTRKLLKWNRFKEEMMILKFFYCISFSWCSWFLTRTDFVPWKIVDTCFNKQEHNLPTKISKVPLYRMFLCWQRMTTNNNHKMLPTK